MTLVEINLPPPDRRLFSVCVNCWEITSDSVDGVLPIPSGSSAQTGFLCKSCLANQSTSQVHTEEGFKGLNGNRRTRSLSNELLFRFALQENEADRYYFDLCHD